MLWFAPRAKVTGYRLFLHVEGSAAKQLRLPARLSQYTLLNLQPDTEYTATLHAEQDNALSEGESAVFTTGEGFYKRGMKAGRRLCVLEFGRVEYLSDKMNLKNK